MKICNLENLQSLVKKSQRKPRYEIRDIFFNKFIHKTPFSWIPDLKESLKLWEFFFFRSGFQLLEKNSPYSRGENFFSYDSKNFNQEKGNPLDSPENLFLIFKYFPKVQKKLEIRPDFMTFQPDINGKMRAILIDWLIDVHNKFKLIPKTLHLTVSILDRFLDQKSLVRQKLQLLGITSMLIASKHEEIYAPETQDFIFISDKSYTKEDIFKMENLICNILCYKFSNISPFVPLSYWLKIFDADIEEIILSIYCFDLTLPELSLAKFSQKIITAGAVFVSLGILKFPFNKKEKSEINFFFQKFLLDKNDFKECSDSIKSFLVLNQNSKKRLTSIKRKFASKKYKEISNALFSVFF